jgi:hypothetical protein
LKYNEEWNTFCAKIILAIAVVNEVNEKFQIFTSLTTAIAQKILAQIQRIR